MYYNTHTRNLVSIFEFFLCHEEPAVKEVCHIPVKVGCQSTLTSAAQGIPSQTSHSMPVWQSLYMNNINLFYKT